MTSYYKLPAQYCLACGRECNAATGLDTDNMPTPGDITICLDCGHIMAFASDLSLCELTREQAHDVAGDRRILAAQRERRRLVKAKSKIMGDA
jgi:hypothetical protein